MAGRQDLLPDDSALYPGFIAMIPGKFAYNMVFSLIMFLQTMDEPVQKAKYIEMFMSNGFVTFTAIFMLTVGATLPGKAFSLTRRK